MRAAGWLQKHGWRFRINTQPRKDIGQRHKLKQKTEVAVKREHRNMMEQLADTAPTSSVSRAVGGVEAPRHSARCGQQI
eukprot:11213398-Lingulodinium_polyedra.AAC.1